MKDKLTPFERLQTRQAADWESQMRRQKAIRTAYDEVRVGRERERQLIAEAERIAERRRGLPT